jgi:5'-deoxynucleotidase YfbR-like HD superfamily hydrolase
MEQRKGDWIETYTGVQFFPFDPVPGEIKIEDIAHALSLICRYNGHCKHFYSVAQHSLNVYQVLKDAYPTDYQLQLAGLLHDAAEAYICDICRPVKRQLFGYKDIEDRLDLVICQVFGIDYYSAAHLIVKTADDLVLNAEAVQLMGGHWAKPNDLKIDIVERLPREVEYKFLQIFHDLRLSMN